MNNLAELLSTAATTNPAAPFGTFRQHDRLDRVVLRAQAVAAEFRREGLGRGQRVAVIGRNCASYIVAWLAGQELGLQLALVNPGYPDEFLDRMLDDLMPTALLWIGREPKSLSERPILHLDLTNAWEGQVVRLEFGARVVTCRRTGRPRRLWARLRH